ncbi:unnamed protein product [Rhodiola kirilowii]
MSTKPSPLPLHRPMALLSGLYCDDETLDNNDLNLDDSCNPNPDSPRSSDLDRSHVVLSDLDLAWDDAEIGSLLAKEEEQGCVEVDSEFVEARKEAIEWMIRVCAVFSLSEVSVALGVSYFDRCLSGVGVSKEKPWMGQLAAVACLSLAAKMEEIDVPLLVDLQVEGAKYVFEGKTVQRMELLVLSGLKWKMNSVTPFSFLDHLIRRFGWNKVHWRFLKMCGSLAVSVIADARSLRYRPSVLAAATMLCVIQEFEPRESFGYQEQLINVLKLSKDNLEECYNLVWELSNECDPKSKYDHSAPSSPHGIIDMSFSCENSNDSWVASSTLEPPSKRRRMQEQQMRLRLPFNWPGLS